MKFDVKNLEGQNVGSVDLDESIFNALVRKDIMARVVNWQLAKRRAGTHAVKNRSDVSGTTKKPYKQKGTGRARHGSLRGVQFRKGGRAFGPVVRDHGYDLPKKIRKMGLKSAIASKLRSGKLIIVEDIKMENSKTKDLLNKVNAFGFKSALFVTGNEVDTNFALASRNIYTVDVLPTIGANVYDILKRDALVLTKDAVSGLEGRLK
ncbi:MAG: 50S ribosomal protein L4 [Alphaproteobacteria bacterium ADurb.Bin438]|nr:MAG: 50S ribosomal protein L4 [Alphaproteobacteria bacterium ADurb.Bin438]